MPQRDTPARPVGYGRRGADTDCPRRRGARRDRRIQSRSVSLVPTFQVPAVTDRMSNPHPAADAHSAAANSKADLVLRTNRGDKCVRFSIRQLLAGCIAAYGRSNNDKDQPSDYLAPDLSVSRPEWPRHHFRRQIDDDRLTITARTKCRSQMRRGHGHKEGEMPQPLLHAVGAPAG